MGHDWAARVVRKDFDALDIQYDFISGGRSVQTPIVIQRFVENSKGKRVHRFSLACPECGGWLPRYRASTLAQADEVIDSRIIPKTIYMDRISPAALRIAKWAKEAGALVVFEPSSIGDERQFQRAVDLCHILKFSRDRLGHIRDLPKMCGPKIIVETRGEQGLRYRWRGHWSDLPAFHVANFVDGAGSGDWCSAGIIHRLGAGGAKVINTLERPRLVAALRFGQALATVNCGFEGARGAMMVMTRPEFAKCVTALATKRREVVAEIEEFESREVQIPKRLCATCSASDRELKSKRQREALSRA
jgi:fructokinase